MQSLDFLSTTAINILKETKIRRSKQALFDVFYLMWAEGQFDGYQTVEPIKDTFGFGYYFAEFGNSEISSQTSKWYDEQFGKRKQNPNQKMVTCGVGELLQETEKAYCFHGGKFTNGKYGLEPVRIWVPKSQVTYNDKTEELTMPAWLAKEKNYMQVN